MRAREVISTAGTMLRGLVFLGGILLVFAAIEAAVGFAFLVSFLAVRSFAWLVLPAAFLWFVLEPLKGREWRGNVGTLKAILVRVPLALLVLAVVVEVLAITAGDGFLFLAGLAALIAGLVWAVLALRERYSPPGD